MKNVLLAGLAGIVLSGCAARGAERDQGQQAALDEVLAGRTAQAPVDCVSQRDLAGNRGYGPNAILFEARSPQLVYLNRPPAGCPELTESRALRTQTTT